MFAPSSTWRACRGVCLSSLMSSSL
ncbi:DUF3649 domain-containing protein [Halomonas aestuarii]